MAHFKNGESNVTGPFSSAHRHLMNIFQAFCLNMMSFLLDSSLAMTTYEHYWETLLFVLLVPR